MRNQDSQSRVAIYTGVAILLMTIVAGVIMPAVFIPIFEANKAGEVDFQINKSLLGIGLIGWFIILITDLYASWGLYRLYANKNKAKSLLMGGARLAYSLILTVAIYYLVRAYWLLGNVSISEGELIDEIITFQSVWQFGLIIFGIHLILLSQLVYDKSVFKKVISALLLIAGIGYFASNILDLIIEDYELIRSKVEVVFILPMILGEPILAISLWARGGKKEVV